MPHFVGLHGLQALPVTGYLLALFAPAWLRTRHRVVLVWTTGLSYLGLVGLLTWQALRGQPVISPDAQTLGVLFALFLTSGAVASAVVVQAWRGRQCDRDAQDERIPRRRSAPSRRQTSTRAQASAARACGAETVGAWRWFTCAEAPRWEVASRRRESDGRVDL